MEDFINNEYFHMALSIFCVVWGIRNVWKNQNSSKQGSKTFKTLDNGYSYLLITAGVILLVWSIMNIVGTSN